MSDTPRKPKTVGLHEVERLCRRSGAVSSAGRHQEGQLFACQQALWSAIRIRKRDADTRNLVDPKLQHAGNAEVVHGHSNRPLVSRLKLGHQLVRELQHRFLLRRSRVRGCVCRRHPLGGDGRDRCGRQVTCYDGASRIGLLPVVDEGFREVARNRKRPHGARIDVQQRRHCESPWMAVAKDSTRTTEDA
jgi:hypothetical protein